MALVGGVGRSDRARSGPRSTTTGSAALPQDLVLGDPGPADMFDDRVYKRGALTLHSLRLELGDDAFFALLRTWVSTHRHATVTTAEFLALAQPALDRPVEDLLGPWLRHKRIPALSEGRA